MKKRTPPDPSLDGVVRLLQRRLVALSTLLALFLPQVLMAGSDAEWMRIINTRRNPWLDPFFSVITDSAPWIAFAIPALMLAFFMVRNNRRNAFRAFSGLLAVSVAALVTTLLKYWINRPRPFESYDFIEKLSTGGSPSFPSGHTTDAFALAIVLTLFSGKWWIAVPAFGWALLVAWSRMHLGVHYPTDVAAGAAVGVIVGALVFVPMGKESRKKHSSQN